jgi:hypothetical protein
MISSGRRRYVWDRTSQSVYRSPKQFPRPARLRATLSTPPASRSSRTVLFPSAARHPRRQDDRSRTPLACAASVSSWHRAGISVSTKVRFAPRSSHSTITRFCELDHGPKTTSTVIGGYICRALRLRADTVTRHPLAHHSLHRELDRRRRHVGVRRIIDVASPVAAIERRTVVAGQK